VRQATEIYTREFDTRLQALSRQWQARIEAHIRDLGRRLERFPHQRLQGRAEFRLRVGDYRVIYRFGRPNSPRERARGLGRNRGPNRV